LVNNSLPNVDSTLDEVQFQIGKYGSSSNINLGYNLNINNTPIFDTDAKSCNNADLFNRLVYHNQSGSGSSQQSYSKWLANSKCLIL
jgi:hypothetical protein